MAAPASARIVERVAPPFAGIAGPWIPYLCVALLLVFVSALATLRTPYRFGANETADSAVYLSSADSALHEARLTTNVSDPPGTPLTHYPPLYPILLASAKAVGLPFLGAAAVLDFLAYFASCLGVYCFFRRIEKPAGAVAALSLLLCAGPLAFAYTLVGPDGPAVALMVLSLCSVSEYLRGGSRRMLVLCGVALATALLLRYVCAAFIPAACLAVLWGERENCRRKLGSALLVASIATLPSGFVLFLNRLLAGSVTDRHLQLHMVKFAAIRELAENLSSLFLPYQLPAWLRCAALAAASLYAVRSAAGRPLLRHSIRIVTLFLAAYLSFLLISISLFDAATPFDDRILAPAVALICILAALLLSAVWETGSWPRRTASGLILLTGIAVEASHARVVLMTTAQTGSPQRLHAQYAFVLPVIETLPKNAVVYSNVPFDIYLVTGRSARTLPRLVGYTDLVRQPLNQIEAQLHEIRRQLSETGGLIIYKIRPPTLWDSGLLSEEELKRRIPELIQLQRQSGFAIYTLSPSHR